MHLVFSVLVGCVISKIKLRKSLKNKQNITHIQWSYSTRVRFSLLRATAQNTEVASLILPFTPGSPYSRPHSAPGWGQTTPFKGKGVLESLSRWGLSVANNSNHSTLLNAHKVQSQKWLQTSGASSFNNLQLNQGCKPAKPKAALSSCFSWVTFFFQKASENSFSKSKHWKKQQCPHTPNQWTI